MKKIILVLVLCVCAGSLFAQDADKLRNEGDAAFRAKKYSEALTRYSDYLKITDYKDIYRIFNAGFCAAQAENYTEAVKFFEMSVKNNYNAEDAYLKMAQAYQSLNKNAEFITTIKNGLKAFPGDIHMEQLLYSQCFKNAYAAKNAKKLDEAVKFYEEMLIVDNKTFKIKALYTIGAILFEKGTTTLHKATPLATSDPDKYKGEKEKADADLIKGKEYLTQALVINPADEYSKKVLANINKALK